MKKPKTTQNTTMKSKKVKNQDLLNPTWDYNTVVAEARKRGEISFAEIAAVDGARDYWNWGKEEQK